MKDLLRLFNKETIELVDDVKNRFPEKCDSDLIHAIAFELRMKDMESYECKKGICLMIDYKYNRCSNFDKMFLDLLYAADNDNIAKLYFSNPFLVETFIKYGRENVNMLEIKLGELDD